MILQWGEASEFFLPFLLRCSERCSDMDMGAMWVLGWLPQPWPWGASSILHPHARATTISK